MKSEIELAGLGWLALISLAYGVVAQVVLAKTATRWLWLIGAVAWFAGGSWQAK